jgi:hypothetical protein
VVCGTASLGRSVSWLYTDGRKAADLRKKRDARIAELAETQFLKCILWLDAWRGPLFLVEVDERIGTLTGFKSGRCVDNNRRRRFAATEKAEEK